MNYLNTGRVKIGCAFDRRSMPKVDEGWQRILLAMKPNERQEPTAAKSGFFNALPRHVAGLAAHRGNDINRMESK